MNRSGIKRGLAVSAISALAVVGIPGLAHAATTVTESSLSLTTSAPSVYANQDDTVNVSVLGSDGKAFADGDGTITVSEAPADTSATAPTPDLYINDTAVAGGETVDLSNGTGTFTVASDVAGTVTVKVADGNGYSDSKTFTVAPVDTTGGTAAVKTLSLSSTSLSEYTNDFATDGADLFNVTALDSASAPVTGATINYTVTDAAGTAVKSGTLATPSPTAPPATYSVDMADLTSSITTAGTYKVNLWVNNATSNATPNADAGEPTGTFTITLTDAPAQATGSSSLVADGNGQLVDSSAATIVGSTAEIPADGKAVTVPVSATIDGADGKPLANTAVRFDVTTSSDNNTVGYQTTTDANGVATVNVPVTAAEAADGDVLSAEVYISDSPTVGAGTDVDGDTVATFTARTEEIDYAGTGDKIQAAPGQTVTVPVEVADQFGQADPNQVLTLAISGDNASSTLLTETTNASGDATFSYTDTATTHTTGDKLTVADVTDSSVTSNVVNFPVTYTTGTLVPATVTFTTDPTSTDTTAPSEEVEAAGQNDYTVQVQNSAKENLANSPVTVSVDKGFLIDASGNQVTSLNLTTKDDGTVSFKAGSTTAGTQNISVAAGSVVAHPKFAYNYTAGEPYSLVPVTAAPVAITSGATQKFVYEVTDEWGNPVTSSNPSYSPYVNFALGNSTDPGFLASATGNVDANGDVVAVLSTSTTDSGSGSIVATVDGFDWASATAPASDGATASFTDPAGTGVPIDYTVAPAVVVTPPPVTNPSYTPGIRLANTKTADKVTITVPAKAKGAKVTLYRKVTGGFKKVGAVKKDNGSVTYTLKDLNGPKKGITYFAKLAKTSTVNAEQTKKKSIK